MSSIPHRDEGSSAAPDLSPGPVENEEILLREIFNPYHIKDGNLLERAISLDDLRKKGFSVHRKEYVTARFVKERIDECLSKQRIGSQWKSEGVATIETLKVRQIYVEDKRAFVVIDTANENNYGHASIYAANPNSDKAHARELRMHLMPLLHERENVSKIFNG